MATTVRPWRTGMPDRPRVPLPPTRLLRDRRPLKRWRYVGFYGDDVHVCVADARIGPIPLSWWAVWDRGSRTLAESTRRRPLALGEREVAVHDGAFAVELSLDAGAAVETVSPHGDSYIWTRKSAPRMRGTVAFRDRRFEVDGRGIVDESAGYHARRTSWMWSAGVGELASGASVAWNLVTGVHDAADASERTVWVEDEPHQVGPVTFAPDLARIAFAEGGALEFAGEATREHAENLLVLASSYSQPFGTFSGSLPGAGELRSGHGVMERHDVRW